MNNILLSNIRLKYIEVNGADRSDRVGRRKLWTFHDVALLFWRGAFGRAAPRPLHG